MRKLLFVIVMLVANMPVPDSRAQNTQAVAVTPSVSGRWIVSADFYGTRMDLSLELKQEGENLTGNLRGDPLEGSIHSDAVTFIAKNERGLTIDCKATVQGNTISGLLVFSNTNDPQPPSTRQFTATLVPIAARWPRCVTNLRQRRFTESSQPRLNLF